MKDWIWGLVLRGSEAKGSEGYYKKREHPMQGIITIEDSRTARAVAQRFIRGFGIAGLAAIASLGLAQLSQLGGKMVILKNFFLHNLLLSRKILSNLVW